MLPMFIPWDCAPDKLYMLVVVLQKLQLYAAQGYDLREGVTEAIAQALEALIDATGGNVDLPQPAQYTNRTRPLVQQ